MKVRKTISGAARANGIDPELARDRMRQGWSLQEATSTPAIMQSKGIRAMAEKAGLETGLVRGRREAGWSLEKALETPKRVRRDVIASIAAGRNISTSELLDKLASTAEKLAKIKLPKEVKSYTAGLKMISKATGIAYQTMMRRLELDLPLVQCIDKSFQLLHKVGRPDDLPEPTDKARREHTSRAIVGCYCRGCEAVRLRMANTKARSKKRHAECGDECQVKSCVGVRRARANRERRESVPLEVRIERRKEANRQKTRQWRRDNLERAKASDREYRKKNRDDLLLKAKLKYEASKQDPMWPLKAAEAYLKAQAKRRQRMQDDPEYAKQRRKKHRDHQRRKRKIRVENVAKKASKLNLEKEWRVINGE